MIASGMFLRGSFASSDSVETASKPRNESASTAAPVSTGLKPSAPGMNGSMRPGAFGSATAVLIARNAKTVMTAMVTAMIVMLTLFTSLMPSTLNSSTASRHVSMNTHVGTDGNWVPMYSPRIMKLIIGMNR